MRTVNKIRVARDLKIWSRRTSMARGLHWKFERDCTEETREQWLEVFRKDEPGVLFVALDRKPK